MLTVIMILLGVAAAYSGGMWLWLFAATLRPDARLGLKIDSDVRREMQAVTFHLGLCCILSLGLLGLLIVITGGTYVHVCA